jgi:hypothetical protein
MMLGDFWDKLGSSFSLFPDLTSLWDLWRWDLCGVVF